MKLCMFIFVLAASVAHGSNRLPVELRIALLTQIEDTDYSGEKQPQTLPEEIKFLKSDVITSVAGHGSYRRELTSIGTDLLDAGFAKDAVLNDGQFAKYKTAARAIQFCQAFVKKVPRASMLDAPVVLKYTDDHYAVGQYRAVSCASTCLGGIKGTECTPRLVYRKVSEGLLKTNNDGRFSPDTFVTRISYPNSNPNTVNRDRCNDDIGCPSGNAPASERHD